jgi:hypothetical protein
LLGVGRKANDLLRKKYCYEIQRSNGRTVIFASEEGLVSKRTVVPMMMMKVGRCEGLTTLPPSCADCLEIWEPQPPGTLRACPGL